MDRLSIEGEAPAVRLFTTSSAYCDVHPLTLVSMSVPRRSRDAISHQVGNPGLSEAALCKDCALALRSMSKSTRCRTWGRPRGFHSSCSTHETSELNMIKYRAPGCSFTALGKKILQLRPAQRSRCGIPSVRIGKQPRQVCKGERTAALRCRYRHCVLGRPYLTCSSLVGSCCRNSGQCLA